MARRKQRSRTFLGVIDAAMATAAQRFIDSWGRLERAYKRPFAWFALRVRFAFYPILAICAVGWLAQDWMGSAQFDRESDPFNCSARLFDDGLIDPRDTRRVLGLALSVCQDAEARALRPTTFGVARM